MRRFRTRHKFHPSNLIHESAIIGGNVVLGINNVIGPNAVVTGECLIGDDNWVGPNVVIGSPPDWQGLKHGVFWDTDYQTKKISIGSFNVIREQSVIQCPSEYVTSIGSNCYLMAQSYVAHDVVLYDCVKLASGTRLAGFVQVAEKSYLGMGTVVHQRLKIGAGAMVGMGSVVTSNILPFSTAFGNPAKIRKLNFHRTKDFGFTSEDIENIDRHYKMGEKPDIKLLSKHIHQFFVDFI